MNRTIHSILSHSYRIIALILVIIISLFSLLSCFYSPSSNENKSNISVPTYKLYIDVTSENNIIFSRYDILISLDGKEIGSVPNGENFTYLAEVKKGSHTLEFCKTGSSKPMSTRTIDIVEDTTYACDLGHGSSSIDIKNEAIKNTIKDSSLEVIDVRLMILSEAITKLEKIGFSNIVEDPTKDIWDKDNWIVTEQSVAPGTKTDKNTQIRLDCIKLDDFLNSLFVGKTISDIESLVKANGFYAEYEDEHMNPVLVSSMSKETKENWIASKVRKKYFEDKTVIITVKSLKETDPSSSEVEPPKSDPLPNPESQTSEPVKSEYYTTNDKETAKEGNKGIYAYKQMKSGGAYDIYFIIDFDEGYVYYFLEGDGNTFCDRVKIVSGDLNSAVIIKYHDGDDTWIEKLFFKYKYQPNHLIFIDPSGFDWDFKPTDLEKALKLRATKTIKDY